LEPSGCPIHFIQMDIAAFLGQAHQTVTFQRGVPSRA
jgi:hypothetical protein